MIAYNKGGRGNERGRGGGGEPRNSTQSQSLTPERFSFHTKNLLEHSRKCRKVGEHKDSSSGHFWKVPSQTHSTTLGRLQNSHCPSFSPQQMGELQKTLRKATVQPFPGKARAQLTPRDQTPELLSSEFRDAEGSDGVALFKLSFLSLIPVTLWGIIASC